MAKLSASQAAKAVGKSVPTITRAIKSGKLSAKKLDGGGYEIEASELFRVWVAVTDESDVTPPMLGRETPNVTSVLQAKLEVTEQRLSDAQATIDDYRARLDAESAERRALTAMLTDVREKSAEPPRKGFWARLVG
jgi:hypothetical protein